MPVAVLQHMDQDRTSQKQGGNHDFPMDRTVVLRQSGVGGPGGVLQAAKQLLAAETCRPEPPGSFEERHGGLLGITALP